MSSITLPTLLLGPLADSLLFETLSVASSLPSESAAALEIFPNTAFFQPPTSNGFLGARLFEGKRKRPRFETTERTAMVVSRLFTYRRVDGSTTSQRVFLAPLSGDSGDNAGGKELTNKDPLITFVKGLMRCGHIGHVDNYKFIRETATMEDWQALMGRGGPIHTRLRPPLDQQFSKKVNGTIPPDIFLAHFDFRKARMEGELDEGLNTPPKGEGLKVATYLDGELTDGECQVRCCLRIEIQIIENRKFRFSRLTTSVAIPLKTSDLATAELFLAQLFPGQNYHPDLYDIVPQRDEDHYFLPALRERFPAGWIPYDPKGYPKTVRAARELIAAFDTFLKYSPRPRDVEQGGREKEAERRYKLAKEAVDRIPFPKPPELSLDPSVCPTCVRLDQGVHTPLRTLYSTNVETPPTPAMVRNRLITFGHRAGGITGRPDSPLMMEAVALARSDPRHFQTVWEEVQRMKKAMKAEKSWERPPFEDRALSEVEAYLLGWYLVQNFSNTKILAAWEKRAKHIHKKWLLQMTTGNGRVTEADIGLLYSIAYRRIKGAKDSVMGLLQRNEYMTSYWEWLLTYVLGEIGDEATAQYFLEILERPNGNQYNEFIRELVLAIHRIYHRLGRLPEEAFLERLNHYYRGMQENRHIQMGVQFGSRVQMREVSHMQTNVSEPCPHEGTLWGPKHRPRTSPDWVILNDPAIAGLLSPEKER